MVVSALVLAGLLSQQPALRTFERRLGPLSPETALHADAAGRVAVVVGINDYQHVRRLHYAVADAQALDTQLTALGYRVIRIPQERANRQTILQAVEDAGPVGTLLFVFTGHGFRLEKYAENYFALTATTLENLKATSLGAGELVQAMKRSGAAQLAIVADACRERLESREATAFDPSHANPDAPFLYSAHRGELSLERSDLGHGVFTHYLLPALSGEAAGHDGWISLVDLAQYVTARMAQDGHAQRPILAGEVPPNLILARSPHAPWTVRILGGGQHYIRVEAGHVVPGCPSSVAGECADWEKTTNRAVTIPAFWMTISEVTVAAWRIITGGDPPKPHDADRHLPAVRVTPQQAQALCGQIGGRLPTNAEYQYVAQAPTLASHPTEKAYLWHAGTAGGKLHHALSGAPNALGFYGLKGNADEYVDAPGLPARHWTQGGGFLSPLLRLQPWTLTPHDDGLGSEAIGFRCVLPEITLSHEVRK